MASAAADAEAAAARVNQEELFHELEQKYLLLKADFAVLESERDASVEQKNGAAAQIKTLQATVEQREAEIVKVKEELLALRSERDQLAFQARTATAQAERRLNDVEELQQTVKEQNKQLVEAQRKEVEALQKAAEQEALVDPLRHSVSRLTSELDATKQHLEWAEKQLTEKTKLVQDMRVASTKITHDLEEIKTTHAEEMASLRKQLESSRQVAKKLESSLVQSKEQVKEVQAARVHEEERLHNELSAQRRLADLYKDSAEDANIRVNELQELCEKLRHSLAESEDALAHQEERTKQQVEHIFREQSAASERRIEALQDELKEAQDRLEELQKSKFVSLQTASAVSGLSTAAGTAHLAANGVTPKELCDQILALETALRAERDEKEQLQISLNRVVEEVHEKAPMIMGLKLDLQRAVASNEQQSAQLEKCMDELRIYRARERQVMDEKFSYERKCEAFAKSVDDLSRQVQHLLFRAHENSHSEGVRTSAGESASENLVVFKDVEELQVRNQQLLMVIREMTEAKKKGRSYDSDTAHFIDSTESDEENDGDGMPASLGKRLDVALEEIEKLRSEREEERQMIAAIVKQRDMYRVLLAQADSKFSESADKSAVGTSAAESSNGGHHHRMSADMVDSRALRELQKDFETYKKEKQTDMKTLQESLERVRTECSAYRLSQMQAEVEAKCNLDRYQAAEKRRQDADEEILRLRGRLDQANHLLIQHQKLLSETEAKFDAASTRLRSLEVEKEGALREVTFLKNNEAKTLQELATLRLDNTNLLKLMDTNRQIESSREERERRDSERMAQKITVLESKLQEAYDKIESNEAVAGAKIAAEEQAKKIATLELDQTKDQLATTREQLARLEEQVKAATSKSALHEKEVTLLREQLRKGAGTAAAERVSALEVQLRQSQRETQSAIEMKKSLTDAVSKYKAIAEANEKSLAELSSASDKWKVEHEKKLQDLLGERDSLRAELQKARAQIKDDVTEGNKLREEMDKMVNQHRITLQESQEKQRQLQIEADKARAELNTLQLEVSSLREDVTVAQENYERELKLHASQVEKYSSTRKQVQEEQKKNRELLSEVEELKARVAVAEKEAADQVSSMEKLLKDANHSKSSLAEQNKLLHTQLERANNQIRRAHEIQMLKNIGEAAPDSTAPAVADREHAKELDDLRSVIAFLRKESEILSSKYELAHKENERYRVQVVALESTTERLRQEIKRVEESNAALGSGIPPAAKQAAQLEQLDLLRESNATLREECQRNLARVRTEEERVKNLEAQLAPLRNSEELLKAQIETLKQEMAALTEANTRWKQRVEQLVEKYQQVDPAEYEKVCAEKTAVANELAQVQARETALKAELESLKSSEGKNAEEEKGKMENLRKQYDRIKGFAKTWKTKAEGLTKQVAEKTKEAEDKASQLVELEKKLAQSVSDKSSLESKLAALEASKSDGANAVTAAASASWEKERQEMKEKMEADVKRFTQLKEMNNKLLTGMKALRQENSQLKDQVSTATAAQAVVASAVAAPSVVPGSVAPKQPPAPTADVAPTPAVPVPAVSPAASVKVTPDVNSTTPAPAKSPLRAPTQAPTATPTLKTVNAPSVPTTTPLNPTAKPFVAPSIASASPAKTPAKTETKDTTATTVPPAPLATATPAPSAAPTPAAPTPTPAEPSAEEKLRLFALQSMKKQFANASKPTESTNAATSTPSKPTTSAPAPIALTKPPLPAATPASAPPLPSTTVTPSKPSVEETKTTVANTGGPFLGLAPPSGSFAAFGAGGASGLVFGKPGITLPVPASPTPASAISSAVASSTTATLFGSSSITTTTTSQSTETVTVATGETEAQRRTQRLARFASQEAAGAAASTTLKRPASSDPDAATTPQKVPKLEQSTTIETDNTETADEQTADDSEATEDEVSGSAVPSPAPPAE